MDASVELVRAMFDRLRADSALMALLGGAAKIVDRQRDRDGKPTAAYPYLSLGPSTSIPADFDCLVGEELTIQLDVWSTGSEGAHGSVECRNISSAVKRALHEQELPLTDNALVTLTWELTRILDDPNPAIRHGAIQFTAIVETP